MEGCWHRATIELLPTQQFWDVWDKVPIGATWWLHRPLGVMVYNLAYRTKSVWNEFPLSNQEFDDVARNQRNTRS